MLKCQQFWRFMSKINSMLSWINLKSWCFLLQKVVAYQHTGNAPSDGSYKYKNNWASAWDFQQFGMCDQQSLRPACAYAQSDQSLCLSLEYSMIVKLLTERHLEFLSLKGGCTGSSESTLVKMSNCWKSRALAQLRKLAYVVFLSRIFAVLSRLFHWYSKCCTSRKSVATLLERYYSGNSLFASKRCLLVSTKRKCVLHWHIP